MRSGTEICTIYVTKLGLMGLNFKNIYGRISGSLAAGLVHNIWLWCRPGLPSELTEDLIDSEDEDERTPPNPFD